LATGFFLTNQTRVQEFAGFLAIRGYCLADLKRYDEAMHALREASARAPRYQPDLQLVERRRRRAAGASEDRTRPVRLPAGVTATQWIMADPVERRLMQLGFQPPTYPDYRLAAPGVVRYDPPTERSAPDAAGGPGARSARDALKPQPAPLPRPPTKGDRR
jgi:hypothetical protein